MHACLDVMSVRDVHAIHKIIFQRSNAKQVLQKNPIGLTDSDYDYILEEI